jgi:hypothetical protein
MPVANNPSTAFFRHEITIAANKLRYLRFDSLRQQLSSPIAQHFGQPINKCSWLYELDDVILFHGVSSFDGK